MNIILKKIIFSCIRIEISFFLLFLFTGVISLIDGKDIFTQKFYLFLCFIMIIGVIIFNKRNLFAPILLVTTFVGFCFSLISLGSIFIFFELTSIFDQTFEISINIYSFSENKDAIKSENYKNIGNFIFLTFLYMCLGSYIIFELMMFCFKKVICRSEWINNILSELRKYLDNNKLLSFYTIALVVLGFIPTITMFVNMENIKNMDKMPEYLSESVFVGFLIFILPYTYFLIHNLDKSSESSSDTGEDSKNHH